jgi:hypothetical protein
MTSGTIKDAFPYFFGILISGLRVSNQRIAPAGPNSKQQIKNIVWKLELRRA